MQINLSKLGKHYNNKWVFKDLDFSFNPSGKYAIIGSNGSGKSTLLKILAAMEAKDAGEIEYLGTKEGLENKHFSFTAPYSVPILEYTTIENIEFASTFNSFRNGLKASDVFELLPKDKRSRKKILSKQSSGMIQRVKLLLALMTDVPIVFLDEPLSNLDAEGEQWYHSLLEQYLSDVMVIIASNNPKEYSFCDEYISMGKLPLQSGKIKDLS